jgi:hypothetical protein
MQARQAFLAFACFVGIIQAFQKIDVLHALARRRAPSRPSSSRNWCCSQFSWCWVTAR